MKQPKRYYALLLGVFLLVTTLASAQTTDTEKRQIQRNDRISQIAKSGDGNVIAVHYVTQGSSIINIFQGSDGAYLETIDTSPTVPFNISLNNDGRYLILTNGSGQINLYDRDNDSNELIRNGGTREIGDLAWNPVTDVFVYTLGSAITLYDPVNSESITMFQSSPVNVVDVNWSPNGEFLATLLYADVFGTVKTAVDVWDMTSAPDYSSQPIFSLPDRGLGSTAWSPDSRRLAITEVDRLIVYDFSLNAIELDMAIDLASPYEMDWSPDGDYLAIGGDQLRIWDTTTWQIDQEITNDAPVNALKWSSNSQYVFNNGGFLGLYRDDLPVSDIDFSTAALNSLMLVNVGTDTDIYELTNGRTVALDPNFYSLLSTSITENLVQSEPAK